MANKKLRILTTIASAAALIFIWGNSMLPGSESGELSSRVEGFLLSLFGVESLPFDVRKCAHFLEYAALGLVMGLHYVLSGKFRLERLWIYVSLGLFAAVADESIQILSGRGPAVADVLLDYLGYITGGSLALLFRLRPKRV